MAMGAVVNGTVTLVRCYRQPYGISQVKMHRLALKIQTCPKGLFRLLLLAAQAIVLAIFNEMRTYFDEGKGYIVFPALFM